MSEWQVMPPQAIEPRRSLRRDFTPAANIEVPLSQHGEVLLDLHVYEWIEGPVTEETDRNELTRKMIAQTREALAAMEASLEPAKQVDFPAEVDPVAAMERTP